MVPIYSTCQWTATNTFRYGAEAKTPKLWVILIRVFLQPVQGQTDGHLIKISYRLIYSNVANWRDVYFSLAILTA
jgi:hypothetical protein